MKKVTTTLINLVVVLCSTVALGQQFKDTITKEFKFESASNNNVFLLANVVGNITVEGYSGDKIILEAERILHAKSNERLEKAKSEIGLGVVDHLDTIIVFVNGPCGNASAQRWVSAGGKKRNNHWNNCKYQYRYKMNFKLKVPQNQNLYLSTVNEGDINVKGVRGSLDVHNVNGAIALKGISGKINAHTINGDVDLDYLKAPNEESYYYTLNGDINAYYPKGLKASMTFKSFNGDFYTNIERVEHRPMMVEHSASKKQGVSFKVDAKSVITVGGGGTLLAFETFNGDVYIKEKQ